MIQKLKIKFLFTLFFISLKFSACSCETDVVAQDYFDSDVVGIITITATYGNEIKNERIFGARTYRAKISFDKLFKGQEFEDLKIFGNSENSNSGACEKQVKVGEKYLILLNKNSTGEFVVSYCSNMSQIDIYNSNYISNYIEIFNYLENNKSKFEGLRFINFYDASEKWDDVKRISVTDFKDIFGKKLNQKFGIYKIKIDSQYNIIKIETVKRIGLNGNKMLALIKKNIKVDYFSNKNPNSEYLLLLNF